MSLIAACSKDAEVLYMETTDLAPFTKPPLLGSVRAVWNSLGWPTTSGRYRFPQSAPGSFREPQATKEVREGMGLSTPLILN